jgi:hypothetical protein
MPKERHLLIEGIQLKSFFCVGKLEIILTGDNKHICWHEDYDTSAYQDTIDVNPVTGEIKHEYYVEDNSTSRTEAILDRSKTLKVLDDILGYLPNGEEKTIVSSAMEYMRNIT